MNDVTIRVRLDTSQAKEQLRGAVKTGEDVAAGRSSAGSVSRGGGMSGGGLIDSARGAFGAAQRAAGSVGISLTGGLSDVISDATSGYRADIDAFMGGPEARAKMEARNQAAQEMALYRYHSGDQVGVRAYYNAILQAHHKPQQMGMSAIRSELGGGRGTDPEGKGPLDKVFDKVVDTIKGGFESIVQAVTGRGGGG